MPVPPARPPDASSSRRSDLAAFYGDFQAFFGIDGRGRVTGETMAIIGANGAGKSTFLKTVAGFLRAPTGSIGFAGNDDPRHARLRGGAVTESRSCPRAGASSPR